ncbi:MAG: hypothetical protein SVW77_00280 [Candidatus Nanohaloarchaea archaeon]|nr:hypothetical protein [Candidatus Nanohaloarchaea archaeon]
MRADLSLDVAAAPQTAAAVTPSLRSTDAVRFDVDAQDALHVTVEADRLGALRGGVNTALVLVRTATKFQDRE